jgi:hypothetical protein
MANKVKDDNVEVASVVVEPKMDIRKYLGKKPAASDQLSRMLLSLYRGQTKTEAEWDSTVKEVLSRKA